MYLKKLLLTENIFYFLGGNLCYVIAAWYKKLQKIPFFVNFYYYSLKKKSYKFFLKNFTLIKFYSY